VTDPVYVAAPQQGYQWLLADDDQDYERLHALATHRPGEAWASLPMHVLDRDGDGTPLQPADLPWLVSTTLAVAPAALPTIRPLLEPYGEFLPVSGSAIGCHLFNCTSWTDALDEEASELARFSDGRIMRIRTVILRAGAFQQAEVVRLKQTPRGPLYFSEALVRRITALKLTGTQFSPRGSMMIRSS
jgi:hypothetical protein